MNFQFFYMFSLCEIVDIKNIISSSIINFHFFLFRHFFRKNATRIGKTDYWNGKNDTADFSRQIGRASLSIGWFIDYLNYR